MAKKTQVSKRKFYRTVIEIEVLSEEPFVFENLDQVAYEITQGHCSGDCSEKKNEEVPAARMAKLLEKQGSDPGFFMLTDKGEDVND